MIRQQPDITTARFRARRRTGTVRRALIVAAALFAATAGTGSLHAVHGAAPPDFGPNVRIFDPSMTTEAIQAVVDAIADQQVNNEMGAQRYALLFKPGVYGSAERPLIVQVGYYTEVAGLGDAPTDVTINGHVDVYNRCFDTGQCHALDNFWRSLSNLTINVMGMSGCRATANFWAVSQAAPFRRVKVAGATLSFMDYCTAGPQFASGGFMADSQAGTVTNGSQQQFMVRDSAVEGWSNGVWNQVFSGVVGAPAQSFPTPPYTTLATSPISRDRPFLYVDSRGDYRVFVPAVRRDARGTSWGPGRTLGSSIPLTRFFVARPTDTAARINEALARGQHLIFTPGIYQLDQTLWITREQTVVLGLGFPTLVPGNGVVTMSVGDVPRVKLAGLLFDAGPVNSPVLLEVGPPDLPRRHSNPADPTTLQDVFFRIGGATPGRATTSLIINSDHVLLDDIWAWRADHGNGVGWTNNTADTGVIVNGDHVTAYGLFVEHYQKYQMIWNGENGRTIMFQNEMPYDPPSQEAWRPGPIKGYAAYKVADSVAVHEAWGLGSYCFFNVDPTIHATRGFEVPNTSGVRLHDLLTVQLGHGTIDHVVNDTGAATGAVGVPVTVVSYP